MSGKVEEKGLNYSVNKDYKMTESRYKLTLNEQKIVNIAISRLDSVEQKDFGVQMFSVVELSEMLGYENPRYDEIRKIVRKLNVRELIIPLSDGELITTWLSSIRYYKNTGTVKLEFSRELAPFLLELRDTSFNTYKLKHTIHMKSVYSIRIYELLNQWKYSEVTYTIEKLKSLMMIEDKYKKFANFEARVLKIAKEEINEMSDIKIDYEIIRQGISPNAIKFIKLKESKKDDDYVVIEDDADLKGKMGLQNSIFSNEQIQEILDLANEVLKDKDLRIEDIYSYVSFQWNYCSPKVKAKDGGLGLLKACIENDYSNYFKQENLFSKVDKANEKKAYSKPNKFNDIESNKRKYTNAELESMLLKKKNKFNDIESNKRKYTNEELKEMLLNKK